MSQMLRTKHRYRLQQKMNNHQHRQQEPQQAAVKVANGSVDKRPLHLQCVDKVHEFPVLEAAFGSFSSLYGRVKSVNSIAEWGFGAAEDRVNKVVLYALTSPSLKAPLHLADNALCCSLDYVEARIPAIKQQPQELLNTVRGAMRAQAQVVARPVLVRAASVKEVALRRMSSACDIGLQRADDALNTRVGSIAVESIDVTLGLAEHLMDSYLPARESDDVFVKDEGTGEQPTTTNRALQTVHRVDRLTRTLQRRLTKRTIAQVTSIRQHAMQAVVAILDLSKTVVSDPKGSVDFMVHLWQELSEDEPENQMPPQTLEQRSTLLAREAARRLVHLVNALAALPAAATNKFSKIVVEILHGMRLEGATHALVAHTRKRVEQLQSLVNQFKSIASQILEAASRNGQQPHANNHRQPAVDQVNNHIHQH